MTFVNNLRNLSLIRTISCYSSIRNASTLIQSPKIIYNSDLKSRLLSTTNTNEFRKKTNTNSFEDKNKDPKDRSRVIPLDVSMKYMESAAYFETYGHQKIWELYRRNYANGMTHRDTRPTCIVDDRIITGNPCPICRDEYFVIHHKNLKLLEQFIDEKTGRIYTSKETHVCYRKYSLLRIEIEKAINLGLIDIDNHFIEYDYSKYKPKHLLN